MHPATALDAAVHVRDADAPTGDAPMGRFLRAREGPASRLLGRHEHLDLRERKGQKSQVLEPLAARGPGLGGGIGHPLGMGTAGVGVTQKEEDERRVDQPHGFHGSALFLAARTAPLLSRILGALDAPCGPVVAERGEGGSDAAGSTRDGDAGGGTTTAAASASATPRRCANAGTDRMGASPSARRVARRTTRRT